MSEYKEMMKGMKILMIVMLGSLVVAGLWNQLPIIKNTVHYGLDPTLGKFLNWDLFWGLVIISFVISLIFTLVQKFATDQNALKELKEDGKRLREQMKEFKGHPEKMIELQKKQFANLPKTMEITMKPLMYTIIPIILLFRWFSDYFIAIGDPKVFIWFGWLGTYFIFAMITSLLLRKIFSVH